MRPKRRVCRICGRVRYSEYLTVNAHYTYVGVDGYVIDLEPGDVVCLFGHGIGVELPNDVVTGLLEPEDIQGE